MRSKRKRADSHYEEQFYEKYYGDSFGERAKIGAFEKIMNSVAPALPDTSGRLLESLGKIDNLTVFELGCGDGGLTARLAREGSYITAIDISKNAVKKANSRISNCDLCKVDLLQMDACHISFKDESFDLVVGKEVLHHLDVGIIAAEINRILKKGGKAIFVEPLAHNPISNWWRKMTPTRRTASEWPLSYAEIQEMGRNFVSTTYEEFDLLPLFSSFIYLVTRSTRLKWEAGEIFSKAEIPFLKRFSMIKGLCASVLIQFTK